MQLLGLQKGDVVLCQSLTFIASVNPVLYLGATPVFIGSEKETWNLCPIALEEAVLNQLNKGIQPKAILVVHLYGMPAKMNEIIIKEYHRRYGIPKYISGHNTYLSNPMDNMESRNKLKNVVFTEERCKKISAGKQCRS